MNDHPEILQQWIKPATILQWQMFLRHTHSLGIQRREGRFDQHENDQKYGCQQEEKYQFILMLPLNAQQE